MADNKRLADLLAGRVQPPSGGPDARIGAQPEPSKGRKLLELLTGYPADPMRDMEPLDGIQMLLTGMGAAKGLGAWGKTIKGTPVSKPSNDIYGEKLRHSRREFFDRATGKPEKRLFDDATAAVDASFDAEEVFRDHMGTYASQALQFGHIPKHLVDLGDKAADLSARMYEKAGGMPQHMPKVPILQEIVRATGDEFMKAADVPAVPATDILHAYLKRFTR